MGKSIWLTWNAVTWCTKYSDWCKNCYALWMALKFKKMGIKKYQNWFDITLHQDVLNFPSKIKKPSFIFANSMTDLFHEDIPFEYLKKIFDVMNNNPKHYFFILTKRAERMLKLTKKLKIWDNIWMWVTIESEKYKYRLDVLKQIKCKYKYIVVEPLIWAINNLNLEWINWVTWWNESWPYSRMCNIEWIENLSIQCNNFKVPFSFKHRGEKNTYGWNKNYWSWVPKQIKEFEKNSMINQKHDINQTQLFI